MIPELRRQFNSVFTESRYREFLQRLEARCGVAAPFRVCETPCFFPMELLAKMAHYGRELTLQLIADPEYLAAAETTVPDAFRVPNDPGRPLFVQADFGLTADLEPKLVEIQGFPSIYAFQP